MLDADGFGAREVGDGGAGEFEDAIECAGRETQVLDSLLEHGLGVGVELAIELHLASAHLGKPEKGNLVRKTE